MCSWPHFAITRHPVLDHGKGKKQMQKAWLLKCHLRLWQEVWSLKLYFPMFKVQGSSSFSRPRKKVWSRHGLAASPISTNNQHSVPEQPELCNKDMLLQPWSSLMGTLIPLKTQISKAHSKDLISRFHSVGLTHFMNMGSKTDNNNLSLPLCEGRKV